MTLSPAPRLASLALFLFVAASTHGNSAEWLRTAIKKDNPEELGYRVFVELNCPVGQEEVEQVVEQLDDALVLLLQDQDAPHHVLQDRRQDRLQRVVLDQVEGLDPGRLGVLVEVVINIKNAMEPNADIFSTNPSLIR